jgi:hypothetical protein
MARRESLAGSLIPILLILILVGGVLTFIDVASSRGKEYNPRDIGPLRTVEMLVWGSALVGVVLFCFAGSFEGSQRYWNN